MRISVWSSDVCSSDLALGIAVVPVQRRLTAISFFQVAHQPQDAGVQGIVQQVPVERAVVVPRPLLAELAAHEQQLLARKIGSESGRERVCQYVSLWVCAVA